MTTRTPLQKTAPAVYRAIDALDASVDLDPALRELVRLRASQLNGCAYCMDYHARDARAAGHSDQKLWTLQAWRKTPFFDDREQAALAVTEALTAPGHDVPDDVWAEAQRHFDESELGNLVGAVIAINAWNLVGVGMRLQPEPEPALV